MRCGNHREVLYGQMLRYDCECGSGCHKTCRHYCGIEEVLLWSLLGVCSFVSRYHAGI